MPPHNDKDFSCSYGRFYVSPGGVERVDGPSLRSMFLPNITPEGRKLLGSRDNFVRGQLKHYGVQFNEKEISGQGTLLLKKVLKAGKCDKVPDHIANLRKNLHIEWLNKTRSGQDHFVGIPFSPSSEYRVSQMEKAAKKINGLHQATGYGPETQTVFMGWNSAAVKKAANSHADREKKSLEAAENNREDEKARLHASYLDTIKRKTGPKTYSPVGSYIVSCGEIEKWQEIKRDLCLDIAQTKEPGIFTATFDFGDVEGVMMISADKDVLEQYCAKLDRGADSERGEDEHEDEHEDEWGGWSENEEQDRKLTTGSKRKRKNGALKGPSPKKAKDSAALPRDYLLRLKCRETGEGVIETTAQKGSIKFKDESLTGLIGKVKLPWIGDKIPFTARKISDTPTRRSRTWDDYSESAYEYARVRRWH